MRALAGFLKDGARVKPRGMTLLAAGRLQLIADRVEAAGRGAMLEALERLKEKPAAEGAVCAGEEVPPASRGSMASLRVRRGP